MKVFGTHILAPVFPWVIFRFARFALSLLIYQDISFVLDAETGIREAGPHWRLPLYLPAHYDFDLLGKGTVSISFTFPLP